MSKSLPRGLRNNNPLNIRHNPSNRWLGASEGNDKQFVTFSSIDYGIRAAFLVLRRYIRYGHDTPRKVIRRWAPDADGNDTSSYMSQVGAISLLKPDEVISYSDREKVCSLIHAMCVVEVGSLYASYVPLSKFYHVYDEITKKN